MTVLLTALAGDTETEILLSDETQIEAILAFEAALAEASAECGFITGAAAAAVVEGVRSYSPDWTVLAAGMKKDGVVVPALVAAIRPLLARQYQSELHKGATSQDAIDTALMLQLTRVFDLYAQRLKELVEGFDQFAGRHGSKTLMAHTRMQVALPMMWQSKIQAWRDPLQRHLRSLGELRQRLMVVQLGGPIGNRGSFDGHGDTIAAGLARRLDLGLAPPWHTQRDHIIALGSLLAQIAGSLGKFGADVALLAQNEIAVVKLTGGGGSSAMAHKSNPVKAEVLVALARHVAGLGGTLNQALVHEYERSGAAWTLEWLTLPPMLVSTGASLRLGRELLGQLQVSDS